MSSEFKEFCRAFSVEHITIAPYHPRSNGRAERFVDTFKRALRKAGDTPTDKAIQQFLQVYTVTPNKNAPSAMTLAEVMFARKIKSMFDKLLPNQWKPGQTNKVNRKRFKISEKVFFRMFQINKTYWEKCTADKQIRNMIYIIKGPGFSHKRHLNQIKKQHSNTVENNPREEDPMDLVFDTFEVPIPQTAPEQRRSKRRREIMDLIEINPKKKKCWLHTDQG